MFASETNRRSAKDKTGESCEECGKPSLARRERKERLCLLLTAESVYGRSTHSTAQTTAPRHMARTSEDEDSNPRPPAPFLSSPPPQAQWFSGDRRVRLRPWCLYRRAGRSECKVSREWTHFSWLYSFASAPEMGLLYRLAVCASFLFVYVATEPVSTLF